jgi:hypothetical protein
VQLKAHESALLPFLLVIVAAFIGACVLMWAVTR